MATQFKTINNLTDLAPAGAGSAANCSNVDCHYNTTVTIADWYNGSLAMSCTYCHQTDGRTTAATNPLPNAHTKHVDEVVDGGYNYGCTACHPDYATSSNWAHQDGVVSSDVVFTGVPWGNDADGDGERRQRRGEVRHRGGGQLLHLQRDQLPRGLQRREQRQRAGRRRWRRTGSTRWLQVRAASWRTGRCGSCHGTIGTLEPSPANTDGTPKANKHPKHHVDNGYGCQECHYTVTTDGTTVADRSAARNGTIEVQQAAGRRR